MRLSKQERIAIIIILVIVIIALGIFLFIVPAAQQIESTLKNLDNKQKEYDAAVEKQATKGPLREQIIEAYKTGEHIADMFFPEMKSYEADAAAREFILQCESNIVVTSLTVSNPSTATLSTSFPTESQVTYALKQYATQGVDIDEAVAKRMERIAALQAALGSSQTIGASVVNFTVKAQNQEELTKFVDEINNYVRNENGVDTRKALMLSSGYSVEYPEVTAKYNYYVGQLNDDAANAGGQAIAAGEDGNFNYNPQGVNPDDVPEPEEANISTTAKELAVTLTFYSIERMQDPTDQLNAQDGITTEEPAENNGENSEQAA